MIMEVELTRMEAQVKKKKAIRIHRESIDQAPIFIEQKPTIE